MSQETIIKGMKYKPIYADFLTGRIIKSRKTWVYMGKQNGRIMDCTHHLFERNNTVKSIPEYLFKGVVR